MKIRTGFVSNSSSSSFVINLTELTPLQIRLIEEHENGLGPIERLAYSSDPKIKDINFDTLSLESRDQWGGAWRIEKEDGQIKGATAMDNYVIRDLLEEIGVPSNVIAWSE